MVVNDGTNTDSGNNTNWSFPVQKTWTNGGSDNDCNNANNWSPVGVPGSTDDVHLPVTANAPTVDAGVAAQADDLAVDSGVTLTVSGNSLTVSGNLNIAGTVDVNAQALTVTGSVSGSGHLDGTGTAYGVDIGGSMGVTQYTATAGTTTVEGNWNVGTFTHNSGVVEFDGAGDSVVYGSSSFSEFGSSTAGKTIKLDAGTTQTIGVLTVAGASGNNVTLQSLTNGSQWSIDMTSGTVTYASVRDSDASGGNTVSATNSLNNGNNVNWNFGEPAGLQGHWEFDGDALDAVGSQLEDLAAETEDLRAQLRERTTQMYVVLGVAAVAVVAVIVVLVRNRSG